MMEFLEMGGYARYVWPSYGVALAVMILNIISARRSFARAREEAGRRVAMSGERS